MDIKSKFQLHYCYIRTKLLFKTKRHICIYSICHRMCSKMGLAIILTSLLVMHIISTSVFSSFLKCSHPCYLECECCRYNFSALTYYRIHISCNDSINSRIQHHPLSLRTEVGLLAVNTCLPMIPSNICEFPNIVAMILNNNEISAIPNLSCLKNIIVIDLSYNNIQILKTGIFDSLTKLMVLLLNFNKIAIIESRVFQPALVNLKHIYLRKNLLKQAELWPFNLTHKFCEFDISDNLIQEIKNSENMRINNNITYGPGYVNVSYNKLVEWPEAVLCNTGMNDITLGRLLLWNFDFRFNPWRCDCKMYTFYSKLDTSFNALSIWNMTCASPSRLAGKMVRKLQLTDFVCNVTLKCPDKCLCQDQPANSKFVVDCSGVGLSSLPDELPSYNNLFVNFKDNNITKLNMRPYLHNITYLDISMNQLDFIDNKAVENLIKVKYWNLSNNHLMDLPKNIRKLYKTNVDLLNNPLQCTCSNLWMIRWLKSMIYIHNISIPKCETPSRQKKFINNIREDKMHCNDKLPTIITALIAILLVLGALIGAYFRFEILTLYYTSGIPEVLKKSNKNLYTEDKIYISCNEVSNDDITWVINNILNFCQGHGIRTYLSFRDALPGEFNMNASIKKMHECNLVLAVVSESYANDQSLMFQLNEIYHDKIIRDNGKLIIIKLGNYPSAYISNPYIKSLFRLKRYINDTDSKLLSKLSEQIPKTYFCAGANDRSDSHDLRHSRNCLL